MEGQISMISMISINDSLGKEVIDNSGNKCGEIKDFIIDIDNNFCTVCSPWRRWHYGNGYG